MSQSIIGTPQAAAATSITLPTHAVGDIIVICAFRDGSTTVPTKPTASGTVPAWVDIDAPTGANTCSMRTAYFVATATNHTSGTWTNATGMAAIVIRGQASSPIGGHAQAGGTANGSATAPAVTLTNNKGGSIILEFYGHRTVTAWSAAPTGYTRQASVATEVCLNTKDSTTADGSIAQSATTTNSGYRAQTIEILAAPTQTGVAQLSLASGSTPATRTLHSIKVRARVSSGGGTIRAALYEGSTNRSGDLESSALTGTLANYTLSIPDANAANITDYSNLEIRLWGYAADGLATTFEVDQVWLEIPAASGGTTSVSKDLSVSYNVKVQIAKSLSPSYNVIKQIQKSLSPSYNVKQQIAKSVSPNYNVIQRISKNLSVSYSVLAYPVNLVLPAITGTPTTGSTLTVDHGTWQNSPTSYAVQWQKETGVGTGVYEDIVGETGDTLAL